MHRREPTTARVELTSFHTTVPEAVSRMHPPTQLALLMKMAVGHSAGDAIS
jgi:hypothetical protein